MKELGIVLDFKAKTINIDGSIVPMRNINLLQGSHGTKEHIGYYQMSDSNLRHQI
jgi:hypothetical protein